MKFKAPWLEGGAEVELPDMKVEGSLEVAELTRKHVDEFLPFITAVQDETTLRLHVNALAAVTSGEEEIEPDVKQAAVTVLLVHGINPDEDLEAFKKQCNTLLTKLTAELIESVKATARVSIESAPFFMKRSLIEAYYMIKAYYLQKARAQNKGLKMPFTQDGLKELISDQELSVFTKHSMQRIKEQAQEIPQPEPKTPEETKKKW